MNSASLPSHLRINLEASVVLLIDSNPMTLEVMSAVFYGFGAKNRIKCMDLLEARHILAAQRIDLIFIDANFPNEGAFDFMRWLRREAPEPACFAPTILLTGHTTRSIVRKARDSGAHAVVAKPVTTGILLNRLAWIAHERRPFVNTEIYAGPDRRWKNEGAPIGENGRRANDPDEQAAEPQKDVVNV
ncbi:MAG: response regulator [Hyphomonadaceae bacterium]|nr:response regulator [Hyphomonadaceae bacterium]